MQTDMRVLHAGLLCWMLGCSNAPVTVEPPEANAAPVTATAPVTAAAPVTPTAPVESTAAVTSTTSAPADESLTLEEYLAAGLPAHDRSWSGHDALRAAAALEKLSQGAPQRLPRSGSIRSGTLFARLVSPQNLELHRNPLFPLGQRLPDALNWTQAAAQLQMLYANAANQGAVGDSENVELLGLQFRLAALMVGVVDELLPTLDPSDPTYSVRMQGLDMMRSGMAQQVSGGLTTLTELNFYRVSELKRLLGYMQTTYPVIFTALTDSSRTEAKVRLQGFCNDPQMQELQPELDHLLTAVSAVRPTVAP